MDTKKSKVEGFFNLINAIENVILVILVIGMISVILIQIIGRVVGHPFPWTEESSRYLFLWMMFIALAAGFNKCESSRVTLLLQLCPAWMKKASEVLYAIVVIGFFAFMIVFGIQVVQQQVMLKEMGTALRIPMYFIGICQPIGAVLGLIGTIESFVLFHDKVKIGNKEAEMQKAIENEEL
ncbi:MAG: TRAP transporter small permease [Lachnospiraceae bacterium]|nr:TRAP transporter small permease [Lachnospiraceae bacterium]